MAPVPTSTVIPGKLATFCCKPVSRLNSMLLPELGLPINMTLFLAIDQPDQHMGGHLIVQGEDGVADAVDLWRTKGQGLHTGNGFTGVKAEFHQAHTVLVGQ